MLETGSGDGCKTLNVLNATELYVYLKMIFREFLGSPVVRTQHFHCRGPGSIPGWGTRIPQSHSSAGKKEKVSKR